MEHVAEVLEACAEGLADGLVAEADAEDGLAAGVLADDVEQQAGLRGDARAGGEDYLTELLELRQLELVVAQDGDLRAQFLHQVTQIVRERVVVVDDYYLHCFLHFCFSSS